MDKVPEVLRKMKFYYCWGVTLNEKELKEVLDYIDSLEQQIDKLKQLKQFYINDFNERSLEFITLSNLTKNIDIILKGGYNGD